MPSLFIKPFNHTPASVMFRLACMQEFEKNDKQFDDETLGMVELLERFKCYELALRKKIRKRTNTVRGRRKSIERIISNPFTRINSKVVYSIAIEMERLLEKHYQMKSGETYVLLSKAAALMAESIKEKVAANTAPATLIMNGVKNGR